MTATQGEPKPTRRDAPALGCQHRVKGESGEGCHDTAQVDAQLSSQRVGAVGALPQQHEQHEHAERDERLRGDDERPAVSAPGVRARPPELVSTVSIRMHPS